MLLGFALIGEWYLFSMFVAINLCVIITEVLSYKIRGHSASRGFWMYGEKGKKQWFVMFLIIACFELSMFSLAVHFLAPSGVTLWS